MHRISLLAITILVAVAADAHAQCVGDCNGNNVVAVNELVTGTNIALEKADVSACPVFDSNGDTRVTVNELVTGVNNLLRECPVISTATPTPTTPPTPTDSGPTQTPTPSRTPIAGCGNGVIDRDLGETCDDGNLEEGPGDDCPMTCRIATCNPTGAELAVDVGFTTTVDLSAIQVFLRYPDSLVRIPGRGNVVQVIDSFSNLIEDFPFPSYSFNDQDYAAAVLTFTSGDTIPAGRLFTVTFDRCSETLPAAGEFDCRIFDASPSPDGVACTVTVP